MNRGRTLGRKAWFPRGGRCCAHRGFAVPKGSSGPRGKQISGSLLNPWCNISLPASALTARAFSSRGEAVLVGFVSGFGGFCLSAAPGALSQAVTPAGPFGSVSRPPSCASRLPGLGNTYFLQHCLSARSCEGFGGGSCETCVQ